MATGSQAKLLRVLENGSFQALGSDATQYVDVRLVSATNANLRAAPQSEFRADLFYRIKMFHVHVPPLRSRLADLPALVSHFLTLQRGVDAPELTPRAWAALTHYDYPGNVRELRSILGHALALCGSAEIDVEHLPFELGPNSGSPELLASDGIQTLAAAQREFERDYVCRTLELTDWNKTQAAKLLGISRKTLWKKLRDLGID
jgi:DNA-binding NtrC family response regulator